MSLIIMGSVKELKKNISELEAKLKLAGHKKCVRTKIENMSSEVVDSNPYR